MCFIMLYDNASEALACCKYVTWTSMLKPERTENMQGYAQSMAGSAKT